MTGLNLESFLHLLRADLGAWAVLGLIVGVLGLMVWTSWGSRRALRKCLVLSVTAHLGLALYGSTFLIVLLALQPRPVEELKRERIRQIRVAPWVEKTRERPGRYSTDGRGVGRVATWDQPRDSLALADPKLGSTRPETPAPKLAPKPEPPAAPALPAEGATAEVDPPTPTKPDVRLHTADVPTPTPVQATPPDPGEVAPVVVTRPGEPDAADPSSDRLRPEPAMARADGQPARPSVEPLPAPAGLEAPSPDTPRPEPPSSASSSPVLPAPGVVAEPIAAPELVPRGTPAPSPDPGLADSNLRQRAGRPAPQPAPERVRGPLSSAPVLTHPTADPPPFPRARGAVPSSVDPAPLAVDPTMSETSPGVVKRPVVPEPARMELPEADIRRRSRPSTVPGQAPLRRTVELPGPITLSRVAPGALPSLPETPRATTTRPLTEIPEVYRSRLDPNRTARAQKAGASRASEQAVERALDWLARHQDNDGRWDGATARYDDGTAVPGEDDYTVHCPPGETCFGTSLYWEADTALTGLALLAYLGSGYTHVDGKYAETVGKGIGFLIAQQKADGDLRGKSVSVGMYCHAMATLALCEAYALTGDRRLRAPVERAINWLVQSRARDGLAWRYAPGSSVGDTSILGWVVLALKAAREVGLPISASVRDGTLTWLGKVSSGSSKGLARYQPWDVVSPTMTAEAWVCRQFLGVGGPGAASTEAADYLLKNGPDRDSYNLYYWYYGTLAMYQHGGDPWTRWNDQVRDQIVKRQRASGHQAGSWDPDDSRYGSIGGRIYCTALATLTLEVYYRFLRLYEEPPLRTASPSHVAGPASRQP